MLHFLQALAAENPEENPIVPVLKEVKGTISDALRGWNYDKGILRNPYPGHTLPMYLVAAKYCPTARELFFKRVEKVSPPANKYMVRGIVIHEVVSNLIEQAKSYVYSTDLTQKGEYFDMLEHLTEVKDTILDGIWKVNVKKNLENKILEQKDADYLRRDAEKLWNYEARLAAVRADTCIAMYGRKANKDTIANKAIPIQVERRIDGSRLGLSDRLSIDSISMAGGPIISDIKTGRAKIFHELTVAGYALVYESITGQPVDVGVIVYPDFRVSLKQPVIEYVLHPLTDDLRKRFIEERNHKLKIVAEDWIPPLPKDHTECREYCDYHPICYDDLDVDTPGNLESYNAPAAATASIEKRGSEPSVNKARPSLFDF